MLPPLRKTLAVIPAMSFNMTFMTTSRMRLAESVVWCLAIGTAFAIACANATLAEDQPESSAALVRRTAHNEIDASSGGAKFMFRLREQTAHGSQTKLMVETSQATVEMLVAYNDKPLSQKQREAEAVRLRMLASDPETLRRKQKSEKEEAERIAKIMKALPDAFLYQPDGTELGRAGVGEPGAEVVRLKFRPNPRYHPPSHVEQVLTAMQGYLLIDSSRHRIAKIDGTLTKAVGFGWGILGHLDRGGHFLVEQKDVSNNNWEVTRMTLAFTGRELLFKSINIQSDEVFSDFRPEPASLTVSQGVELLKKHEAELAENHHPDNRADPDRK